MEIWSQMPASSDSFLLIIYYLSYPTYHSVMRKESKHGVLMINEGIIVPTKAQGCR